LIKFKMPIEKSMSFLAPYFVGSPLVLHG